MGVAPSDIQTLEDVRKLPFTDKAVLRDTFPYGLFAVPLDDIARAALLVGHHWKARRGGLHRRRHGHVERLHRPPRADGRRRARGHRAQMAFGYGMFTGGFGLHYGLQQPGLHAMIPAGSGNTERHIADDRGLRHHRARGHALLRACTSARWGRRWATIGRSPPCAWACSAASPARRASRPRSSERMHIVCTDNYGLTEVMGPGVSGECLAERDHAAHRRGPLPVGGRSTPRPASRWARARWASSCSRPFASRPSPCCATAPTT